MVSKRKKKYQSGEGAQFISRKAALKKLQLSLKDFRRLCILKGIYPREPRNRKRAQHGDTQIKTLYHKKDIQFLMHEPIIWKFRDYKIFNRKVGRAKALRDFKQMRKYLDSHPQIKLDHIVKERYPTFIDALRDLDDCLTLCFLFSTFPSLQHIPRELSALCRRLTTEFMHAVIEAKALRKVFISIKGYYYQAEIKGQSVTWIVPHYFSFQPQSKQQVDFKIMSTFVEFYTILLGFVNFRLYHTLNLIYPPNLTGISGPVDSEKSLIDENAFVSERIACLNFPVSRTVAETVEEDVEIDEFDTEGDADKIEEKKAEHAKIKKLKTLFKGLKFFVNREVPREPLVFMIRSFGGEISWDKDTFLGATFQEDDETITHQVVDRPKIDKQYISRYYIQPQWVFDCINARELLSVQKYFIGAVLPPHLSPFIDPTREQEYIPPEERALRDPSLIEKLYEKEEHSEDNEQSSDDDKSNEEDDENNESNSESEEQKADKKSTEKMLVTPGQIEKVVPWEQQRQERLEYRLREKMIKKKHRNLYKSMMEGRKDRKKEIWLLRKKRRLHEEKEKGITQNKSGNKEAKTQNKGKNKQQNLKKKVDKV